jgi:hypothetical protein
MSPTAIDGASPSEVTMDGDVIQEITMDGNVVYSAGLNGLFLDEWADNKLSSRDDFDTTPYEEGEPSSSSFSTSTRPAWSTYGNVAANNKRLEIPDGAYSFADQNDWPALTWETRQYNNSGNAGPWVVAPLDDGAGVDTGGTTSPENGYGILYKYQLISSYSYGNDFRKWVNGSGTQLIEGEDSLDRQSGDTNDASFTFDGADSYEFFSNGTSQGTATDTTYDETDADQAFIGHGSDGSGTISAVWLEGY